MSEDKTAGFGQASAGVLQLHQCVGSPHLKHNEMKLGLLWVKRW